MKKKMSIIIMSFVICLTMALPVDAASNYFTGSTGTMNSLFGNPSASRNISSGSVPSNASVSSVKVNVNVSPGSDSFYLYVKHPSGYSATRLVGSTSLSFTEFNGLDPYGTWQVYIVTTGTVSTATARMTVDYTY